MSSLIVFFVKEIREQMRTYKTLIILLVLLLFGISSPIFAKMMPEFLGKMDLDYQIIMPEPTYLDAFGQFFNNMNQMVVIVMILVFSGVISQEKNKGTLVLMLTKRISRVSFVLSKFIAMVILWTTGYVVASLVCIYYTNYVFPAADFSHLFLPLFCLWLFIVLILAITIFTSSLSSNPYLGTFGAFVGWFVLLMSSYIPKLKEFSPLLLSTNSMPILKNLKDFGDLKGSIVVAIILIITLLLLTCCIFKKQEI